MAAKSCTGAMSGALGLTIDTVATWSSSVALGTTNLVSTNSSGVQGIGDSDSPTFSADGRYVAFESYSNTLVAGDSNTARTSSSRTCKPTSRRKSTPAAAAARRTKSARTANHANGRYVVFTSFATNLVTGDTNGSSDIFVKDLQTGIVTRVSTDSAGNQGNGASDHSTISADGRYVAFESQASNLVPGDTNSNWDVFVKDLQTGITTRVSTDIAGNQGNNYSQRPTISADGRYVAFLAGPPTSSPAIRTAATTCSSRTCKPG